LDARPQTLFPMLEVEKALGARSSIYVRVTANEYNAFSYNFLPKLQAVEKAGFEIGLHSNFVEFAMIAGLDPGEVLQSEVLALSQFFDVTGMSCHRDINYAYNSLPWLIENWPALQQSTGLAYQAYDDRFMKGAAYINEGLNPHLCWRSAAPEDVFPTGQSVYLLTHNHWWYSVHPFEN
jgi:hypothetical protein